MAVISSNRGVCTPQTLLASDGVNSAVFVSFGQLLWLIMMTLQLNEETLDKWLDQ